jgi:asparagine synthase (glutamine-hydrolysing)
MCGFVGVFSYDQKAEEQMPFIHWANKTMIYRGPDSEGAWNNKDISLGFRRLAIRDLHDIADQPMHSACQRYVMVFNGELYGIDTLRQDLAKQHNVNFLSTSDTEVLLYSLIYEGADKTLQEIDGIFAFVFYDKKERRAVIGRDRSGVKPLYILKSPKGVVFSSQYDHISNHDWNTNEIDPASLKSYLQFGYIPNGYALYKNTYSLPNGSYQIFKQDKVEDLIFYYEYGKKIKKNLTPNESLEQTIDNEVTNQLVGDVPVGVFLSGGVDSPIIANSASKQQNNISSFTIDVDDERYSEGLVAAQYADKFNVSPYVKTIKYEDLYGLIEDNIKAYSEPFNDYSSLPTLMVSAMAKEHVTVCLSGDGGDELFYGYDRNKNYLSLLKEIKRFGKIRKLSMLFAILKSRFSNRKYLPRELLGFSTLEDYYIAKNSITGGKSFADYLIDGNAYLPKTLERYLAEAQEVITTLEDKMDIARKIDIELHLPRILLKVDRASMYHSLEVRVPILGKKILNLSQSCSFSESIVNIDGKDHGKYPLKKLLSNISDSKAPFMQKKGFTIPIKEWLEGPLKSDIYKTLQNMPYALRVYLEKDKVEYLLEQFYDRKSLDPWPIWGLFTLVKWHQHHVGRFIKRKI